MENIKIGIQLYSVRNAFEKDINKCFKQIKEIGYDGVELYGPYVYSAEKVKKALIDNSLEIYGYHTEYRFLNKDFIYAAIEYNKKIGNNIMICPYIGVDVANTKEEYLKIAKSFTEINEVLKNNNIKCGYHSHDIDFRNIDSDEMPWDIIFQNVPSDFIMQLDTANVLAAGKETPQDILKRYPMRSETLHYKTYSEKLKYNSSMGEDDLNWNEIFKLTKNNTNCKYIIVEDENETDDMLNIKNSYKFIKEKLK